MRKIVNINQAWEFIRDNIGHKRAVQTKGDPVNLPHTWNAVDGQDGGDDYYRGICWYVKRFTKPELEAGWEAWLEFRGVAMTAEVYLNGVRLARHEGGYSTFRVNIIKSLRDENVLAVSADNSVNKRVYPQKADFTFYGGIYRDVYLITVPKAHFALGDFGGPGIRVTPRVEGSRADILVETCLENAPEGSVVRVNIDGTEKTCPVRRGKARVAFIIENPHLWRGVNDPYLYTVKAELAEGGDSVFARFGCRSFSMDAEKGFFLNGESYPLRGVSRHQDRKDAGSAISREMQKEDMDLIQEIGVNAVRLAHYQHDQYFYDLCDEAGIIVWTEIPYITEQLKKGRDNAKRQMTELVTQNYNHPSIVCWGLSNEITASGAVTKELIKNIRELNDLCHKRDQTRSTVMANVFMLETESPLIDIPDIRSYNLYYGWYVGELGENGKFFDQFHAKYPDKIIGFSEYGADAVLRFQTADPKQNDFTEQYQALYHEYLLETIAQRPYLWSSFMWNMFDFGADGRNEGGDPGVNHKGLVSFDRKIKKDAFYLYKAYFSSVPFVYICGRRYIDRTEDETTVRVYSNQSVVSLYCDGVLAWEKEGDRIFCFQVPVKGNHIIEARAGALSDTIHICKAAEPNPAYTLIEAKAVNWFDEGTAITRGGYFSIKDKVGDIIKVPEGKALIDKMMEQAVASFGNVAKGVQKNPVIRKMLNGKTIEDLMKMAGGAISGEMVSAFNKALNEIRKPEGKAE
jgi:beta-galactosidase